MRNDRRDAVRRAGLAMLIGFTVSAVALADTTTTTSTSTTTSTVGCPTGATFDSIKCREAALLAAVQASTEFKRTKFQGLLVRQLGLLQKRTNKAETQHVGHRSKNGLKGAIAVLKTFDAELSGRTGKSSLPSASARQQFQSMADAIRTDMTTLRGTL